MTFTMITGVMTSVSLRRCFYLSAVVLVLSTLMAAVIIVKLTPLESIKCQPHPVTPGVEWSTVVNQQIDPITTPKVIENNDQKEMNNRRYKEMREKSVQNKIARMSRRMRNKILPLLNSSVIVEPNYNIHIFYYPWYRSKEYDGNWKHWNHDYLPNWKKNDKRIFPQGSHDPPADIGANFYPDLGCYSSFDPKVIKYLLSILIDIMMSIFC